MKDIQVTITRQEKKEGTKTVWIDTETETKTVDKQFHINTVESAPFMRRLGGSETLTRSYTSQGYNVTRIVSTSPDKAKRSIYSFDFDACFNTKQGYKYPINHPKAGKDTFVLADVWQCEKCNYSSNLEDDIEEHKANCKEV